MATQAERRSATRQLLIDAGRQCFADHGYEDTSTEQIRAVAAVSRGALYHHFPSKRALFEAVFVQVSSETIKRALRDRDSSRSPLDDLISVCLAWLREAREPEATLILIEQGPHVLGWKRARDLEATTSLGLMTTALERAATANEVNVASIRLTARLLNAILAEAALAHSEIPEHASSEHVEHLLRQFLGA